MKIVLDNNVFFSLMDPSSVASYIFFLLGAEFFIPEYIKIEFEKYKSECLSKSKLSEHEFEIRQKEVKETIKLIKLSEYKKFLKQSAEALSDPKDTPYLALALSINAVIWSNDPHLRGQSLVEVFKTSDILNKLLKGEL